MIQFNETRYRKPALLTAIALGASLVAVPAAAQYNQKIRNDMGKCTSASGPGLMVTVDGIKTGKGEIRVQSYKATAKDWLETGKWLSRIEVPARQGSMTFCVPVSAPGTYGIAVRHDVNGNGKTDITEDGGAMSNNPSINIFNLGKPSYTKVGVDVGNSVKSIRIQMKYM